MLRGLDNIKRSLDERGSFGEGVPELSIRQGEVAQIHFLTDTSEIVECRFHRITRTTQGGNQFTDEKFCRSDIEEQCEFCGHHNEDVRRRTMRWYAWVYVYGIYIPTNANIDNLPPLEKKQHGVSEKYWWEINSPAILRKGEGNQRYIVNQLMRLRERYGTFLDRRYEWDRSGSKRDDTTYQLTALDPDPMPEINVPNTLEEVITQDMSLSAFPARSSSGGGNTGGGGQTPSPSQSQSPISGNTSSSESIGESVDGGGSEQAVSRLMGMLGGSQEGNL